MITLDHARIDCRDQEDAGQPVSDPYGEPMTSVTVPAPVGLDVIAAIPETLAETDVS
jgi:hypothetical protein